MGGAVLVRALELQHDIAGVVEFEPFIGDGGAGDVATQLLQFFTLIHGAAHLGVEAEPLFADTAFLGRLRIKVGNRLQAQHCLARPGSEGDAVGAGGRLQWRHDSMRLSLGQVNRPLLFNKIAATRQ